MDFSSCVVLLSLCFISWFLIQSLLGRRTGARLPPGPKPFPLVGNLFELGEKPHISLTKLSQHYGSIMSLKLGQVTTIVVSSAAMAKEILKTHDQFFCNRTVPDAIVEPNVANYSLPWIPVSPMWRKLRKICNLQLFSTKALDANQADRRAKVQELIASVNESMVKGVAVNIGDAVFKTTLNSLSRTIFSIDLADTSSSSKAREFKEIVWGLMEEAGKPNLGDFFPVLRKLDLQGIRRRFLKYRDRMSSFHESVISERLKSRKRDDFITSNDMLDTLLNVTEEKTDEEMNDPQVSEQLFLALFTAGTDTTSTTLEWAMAELLHNPRCLSKAQEELDQIIGKGKPIGESDFTRLPYLRAVIKETFRLHASVPFLLPRKAETDVEIGDYIVPKGALVFVNAWAIGRDASIWDNPNSFEPERFMGFENEVDVMGKSFELIPFGGGRRICPGLPLAMRMLHLILGSLINSFNWKLEVGVAPETMNLDEKFGLTVQLSQPLTAVPKKL